MDEDHRWLALRMGVGATAPLSEDDVAALAAIMTVRKAKAGEALFCRDDDLIRSSCSSVGRLPWRVRTGTAPRS